MKIIVNKVIYALIILSIHGCKGQGFEPFSTTYYPLNESKHVFTGGIPIKAIDNNRLILDDGPGNVFTLLNVGDTTISYMFNMDSINIYDLFNKINIAYPELSLINPDSLKLITPQTVNFIDKFDISIHNENIWVCFYYEGFYYNNENKLTHHPFKFIAKFNSNLKLEKTFPIIYNNAILSIDNREFPYPDIQGGYYSDGDILLIKNGAKLDSFNYFETPYLLKYKLINDAFVFDEIINYYPDSISEPFDFDNYDFTRIEIHKFNNKFFFCNNHSITSEDGTMIYSLIEPNSFILDYFIKGDSLLMYEMIFDENFNTYNNYFVMKNLSTNNIIRYQIPEQSAINIRSISIFNSNLFCIAFTEDKRFIFNYAFK